MERTRPDPEVLLAAVNEEESRAKRGALKIFFGAAAGVGKTYAMLEAARKRRAEGVDVVIGLAVTHGRAETERLLEGLELLPLTLRDYRGIAIREFDLDAALRRQPQLLLVDELAHTNSPGSWHAKRWQDILDILDAGINVYTTLNVQHLEGVNDIIGKITGIAVRETVSDSIFDRSDEVELVDLTPDDLLQRLAEGKVYIPEQAQRAMSNFFTKGNLIALRELALRRAADRVEAQMETFRQAHASQKSWPVMDRILVAVSPSPYARRVVRAAWRMASKLRADWIVAFVEPPSAKELGEKDRSRAFETLRLAEELGAQTVTLTGEKVAAELIRYALQRNANKIVVGKPGRPRWRDRVFGSMVDDLIRNEAGIDVFVIRGQLEEVSRSLARGGERFSGWWKYLCASGVIGLCTIIGWPVSKYFDETSSAMLYVLGVVLVALLWGRGPSIAASVMGVLCFDFFFIPPFFSFTVFDIRALFTFLVILVVGNVIASLTLYIKRQAEMARRHEQRTEAMYRLTQDLAGAENREEMIVRVERNLSAVCQSEVAVLLPDDQRNIRPASGSQEAAFITFWRVPVAQWVLDHGKQAGLGTETLPSADSLYLPLKANRGALGVLAIRSTGKRLSEDAELMLLIETLARHAALAFEHLDLVSEANRANMRAEAERLQNTLLSSVSHDLRTPLASITGAASTLIHDRSRLDQEEREELLNTIHHEANRLNRLVTNLLDMTRLQTGAFVPVKDWQSVEELVGAALHEAESALKDRPVEVRIDPRMPLIQVDGALIVQALLNLLDNAVKYTPAGSPLRIEARSEGPQTVIEVLDQGPGFPLGEEERVFDKFFRGSASGMSKGAGLGLAICRGFIEAHGGRIMARNRPGGGALFEIVLPAGPEVPKMNEIPSGIAGDSREG